MKRVYGDILMVVFMVIIMFGVWSVSTTDLMSITILSILFGALFLINLYYIYYREINTMLEKVYYGYLFYLSMIIIMTVLVLDDNPWISSLMLFLIGMMVLSGMIIVEKRVVSSFNISEKKRRLLLFKISSVIVLVFLIILL